MSRNVTDRADLLPVLGEVFREYGFEGATLSVIGARTGLGKGSLYHFFPGGKEEMAQAVLADIESWFETHIFAPLREEKDSATAVARTLDAAEQYFRSGRRVCLVGALALNESRELFAKHIRGYFEAWAQALGSALIRGGHDRKCAKALAEETLSTIQGGLVMARALDNPEVFQRALARVKARMQNPSDKASRRIRGEPGGMRDRVRQRPPPPRS